MFHYQEVCIVSNKRATIVFISVPLYMCLFSLAILQFLLFIIGFNQFDYNMFWCILLQISWVSWIYGFTVFLKFGKCIAIVSSNIFSAFPTLRLQMHGSRLLQIVPQFTNVSFFLSHFVCVFRLLLYLQTHLPYFSEVNKSVDFTSVIVISHIIFFPSLDVCGICFYIAHIFPPHLGIQLHFLEIWAVWGLFLWSVTQDKSSLI